MELHFFEDYLKEKYDNKEISTMYPDDKGNVQICCPFKHTREEFNVEKWDNVTVEYYEKVPSSSINLDMRVFHCFTCDRQYKELEFAQAVTGKSEEEIIREYTTKEELKDVSSEWKEMQHKKLLSNPSMLENVRALKISDEVIEQVSLGEIANYLAIPVFKKGSLVNIARYNVNKIPDVAKVLYNANANSGDIVPFDIWKNDNRPTIFCEGEKDMLIARSHNFNAITITGGSQSKLQREYLEYFKDRDVYICYDNDDAGRTGANKRFKELNDYCKNVYLVDISEVCVDNKEDVADFFIKYNKSEEDFKNLIENTKHKLSNDDLDKIETKYEPKKSKIELNVKNSSFNKLVSSNLQIIATCTETYAVNTFARFIPLQNNEEEKLEPKTWFLDSGKETFLQLIESKVTKDNIIPTLSNILGIGKNWGKFYKVELGPLQTIYKTTVADQILENDDKASEFTVDMYSKQPLEIGNTYEVNYKIYPHPTLGRKVVAIADSIKETEIKFMKDDKTMKDLEVFKVKTTLDDKIEELYQSARCHIAPYLNKDLWLMMDLVYNSPLDITYKNVMRGALDIFVLGDTRTGKSETSRALRELYNFGEVVPLKTATVASLIGGTDDRLKRTKLGVLPRYHKELIVLEEFSGAPVEFIKTLTEIRSSGIVKIYRVAGDVKAPCKLRMITISNPISDNGNLMTVSSFPNAIEPINELIKSPEDIARYDAFIIVPQVEDLTNPFSSKVNESYKIPKEIYQEKIKWIRTLNETNVKISNELGSYIFEKAMELNDMFESSFTLFGSETDKKIARFASALACLVCSTNDYENVIVTKEHVDYIVELFKRNYDNEHFRLKEFANEEKLYKKVVEEDTHLLESYYIKNVVAIDFLAGVSKVNRNEFATVSGFNKDEFTKFFNILVSKKFIKLNKDQVVPTVKFRKTYKIMNKDINLYEIS